MNNAESNILCTATLHRPAIAGKAPAWTFLVLPKAASSGLNPSLLPFFCYLFPTPHAHP